MRSAARLRGSLNANLSATEVIKGHGMDPGTSHARVDEVAADEAIASILGLQPGAPVLRLERVRTADGRPVIFTIDVIPTGLFRDAGLDVEVLLDPGLSLYRLYAERLGRSITDGQASIRLTRADTLVADRLGIPAGSPILRLEQVDATAEGEAVLFSRRVVRRRHVRVQRSSSRAGARRPPDPGPAGPDQRMRRRAGRGP